MLREIGNKNIQGIPASATVAMGIRAKALKEQGANVISLAGGEPDFDTPELIRNAAKEALDKGRTHYTTGTGIKELREAIVEKMRRENAIDASADNIIVTPGGKFGLYMTMQALLNDGDEVMLITPAWVSYAPMIMANGGKVVPVETTPEEGFRITREKLCNAVTDKTKLLILCSPSNPTGHVIGEEEGKIIADFLEETGVYLIADEMYERLWYKYPPFSIGSIPKVKDQVITVMGFSKAYAMTGWRLGWLHVPAHLKKLFSNLYSQEVTCTTTFVQDAAVHAFACEKEVLEMRSSYEARGKRFVKLLNEIDGVSVEMPDGAFYVWVKIAKDNMTATQICNDLLEKEYVAGVPGIAFGDTRDEYVRFTFAQAEEDLIEAAARIRAYMEKQ